MKKISVYEKEMSEMDVCCEIHQNILQQNKQRKVTKPIIKLIKAENSNHNFVSHFHSLMLKKVWKIQ